MSLRSRSQGTYARSIGYEAGRFSPLEAENPYEPFSANHAYWVFGYEDGCADRELEEAKEPDRRMDELTGMIRRNGDRDAIADAIEMIWEKLK